MPAEKESADLGTYEYWHEEYSIASKELKDKFHSKGDRVIDKLLDNGGADDPGESMYASRLNLFHSNIVTLSAMLYGQDPRVDVDRRHKDTEDDVARVATEMLERILNNDIALDTDGFLETIRYSLNDYLVPGLGCARVRYSLKTTTDGGEERMVEESAPVDYVHWKDFLWSPARVWDEVRWVGFRTFVSKEEATKRWSASVAKKLPYTSQRIDDDEKDTDPSKRAEVWEIWCKETKTLIAFL